MNVLTRMVSLHGLLTASAITTAKWPISHYRHHQNSNQEPYSRRRDGNPPRFFKASKEKPLIRREPRAISAQSHFSASPSPVQFSCWLRSGRTQVSSRVVRIE